jgi:hypothetical protein
VIRARALGLALLVLVVGAMPAAAEEWTLGVSGFLFDPPDDDVFLSPIVEADRGVLHLEARYNYEDLETGSAFVGRTFEFGKDVAWTVVPLLGLVLGQTDGLAPGVKLDVGWRKLAFSTESEVVIPFEDAGASFVYSWLQGTVAATEGLRLGVVGQRTKTYETGLEFQRGPMIELSRGRGWLGFYWFNLDRPDDETFVFAGGWEL